MYEFATLLFGLSTDSYIFIKIMKPVIKTLRKKGFQSIIYLDFLLLRASNEKC